MAHKGMIELGKKPSKMESPSPSRSSEVYYPSFYVDRDIGLSDKDVGKTMIAIVKVKVKSVEKRISEKRKSDSSSFDLLGINLKPGKVSHYGKEE